MLLCKHIFRKKVTQELYVQPFIFDLQHMTKIILHKQQFIIEKKILEKKDKKINRHYIRI